MAFQTRQQHHFSRQIITTNKLVVSNEAATARINNPVEMGSANPFATTVDNPWVGMNHMLLGSNNMVVQPQPNNALISAHSSGPSNMLPNGHRKRSGVSTENQVNDENVYFPVPEYAPENIKNEMLALRETDRLLRQQRKRIKIQFAEKQNQAVQHLVESVRSPLLNKLKEKDAENSNLGNLNKALQENVKNLRVDNQKWKERSITWEIEAMSLCNHLGVALDEIRRLKGLLAPNGGVAAPHEEQDVKSYCGSNVSEKNKPAGNAQAVAVEVVGEAAAEKVKTGAAETGEGSGVKRMCRSCGEMERSVLALPCCHLCFCIVCGARESRLHGPCPVCETTITATAPLSLI